MHHLLNSNPACATENALGFGLDGMKEGDRAVGYVNQRIEFRAGDGPMIAVEPDCRLDLERAPHSMVLSWHQQGQPMNAAVPLVELNQFLQDGKLSIGA